MNEELVVLLEVVLNMVQNTMIKVVATHPVGDYGNAWDSPRPRGI
jgi:hypothetical protein